MTEYRAQFDAEVTSVDMVSAEQGNYTAAEACYQEALRLNPAHADAHSNLANWYKDQGRLVEAVESYGIALAYQPDSVSAHWNRSLAWLQMGDFERGWPVLQALLAQADGPLTRRTTSPTSLSRHDGIPSGLNCRVGCPARSGVHAG